MFRSFRSLVASLAGARPGEWTLRWYGELWRTPLVLSAFRSSALVALLVGILAPLLGLLAALAIRELRVPRLILLAMLMPLFIPGVSMGLASAFLFRLLGIAPSLTTIVIVQTLWALPFATLIILTAMTTFDPQYLEAAYMAGAGRWRAFRDIELPLIASGITGAVSFSAILSINENDQDQRGSGPVEHGSDLYLVDLSPGRPVAGALCVDGADHHRDDRHRARLSAAQPASEPTVTAMAISIALTVVMSSIDARSAR